MLNLGLLLSQCSSTTSLMTVFEVMTVFEAAQACSFCHAMTMFEMFDVAQTCSYCHAVTMLALVGPASLCSSFYFLCLN
jgi:hypothetical protein